MGFKNSYRHKYPKVGDLVEANDYMEILRGQDSWNIAKGTLGMIVELQEMIPKVKLNANESYPPRFYVDFVFADKKFRHEFKNLEDFEQFYTIKKT